VTAVRVTQTLQLFSVHSCLTKRQSSSRQVSHAGHPRLINLLPLRFSMKTFLYVPQFRARSAVSRSAICVRKIAKPTCYTLTLLEEASGNAPTASMPANARPHCILRARDSETSAFVFWPAEDEHSFFPLSFKSSEGWHPMRS